jgi:hypothetical protein
MGALDFFVLTRFAAGRDRKKGDKNQRLTWVAGDCFHGFAWVFNFVSLAIEIGADEGSVASDEGRAGAGSGC